jgi:hypothetical protein
MSEISSSQSTPVIFDSASLQVPGEPGVYFCAKHKTVKTRLRCGRCEKPICPKCTKMGPTGARCADCLSNRGSHMYQVSPLQFLLAFGMAFGCSVLGGMVSEYIGFFFLLFYGPVVGSLIAKAIIAVIRGKRGLPLTIVASAGVVLGAITPLIVSYSRAPLLGMSLYAFGSIAVFIGLTISSLWYWLR